MSKFVDGTIFVLVVVGGLAWGLIGAFDYNVVEHVFGAVPVLIRVLYVFVGLSALVMVFKRFVKK